MGDLYEIPAIRQVCAEPRRRWFVSPQFDLLVWYKNQEIFGFQLSWDLTRHQKCFTWRKDLGFFLNPVDSGEDNPRYNRTPTLLPCTISLDPKIHGQFGKSSGTIDLKITQLVLKKLRQLNK